MGVCQGLIVLIFVGSLMCSATQKESTLSCNRLEEMHDYKSRLSTFLCIHDRNLDYMEFFHDMNPNRTLLTPMDPWVGGKGDGGYTWPPQCSKPQPQKLLVSNMTKPLQQLENDETDKPDQKSNVTVTFDGINFTKSENLSMDGHRTFWVFSPLKLVIKAPAFPFCSQYAAGRNLEDCQYLISGDALTENCTFIREAVVITIRILAYTFTKAKTVFGRMRIADVPDKARNESGLGWQDCGSISGYGEISEVRYRNNVIGVFASLDTLPTASAEDVSGFPLRLTYTQVYIYDKEYANLAIFWNRMLYSKCPEQFCWRDIIQVNPADMWRLAELDDILWRNFMYCMLPFAPILLIACIHSFM